MQTVIFGNHFRLLLKLLKVAVLAAPIWLCGGPTLAQEPVSVETSISQYGIQYYEFPIQVGVVPFLELSSGGYTSGQKEFSLASVPYSAKFLGSIYFWGGRAVADFGVGRFSQSFENLESQQSIQGFDKSSRQLNPRISANFSEVALRYQFANRWQIGVMEKTIFDVGSSFGADQADALFAGLSVAKEFNMSRNWVGRIGGRFLNDININAADVSEGGARNSNSGSQRDVQWLGLDLSIGWNLRSDNQVSRLRDNQPARQSFSKTNSTNIMTN